MSSVAHHSPEKLIFYCFFGGWFGYPKVQGNPGGYIGVAISTMKRSEDLLLCTIV
jgi:hypothetical protein